jgi:hypothetical protein
LILGIGINTGTTPLPSELAEIATTLPCADRDALLRAILAELDGVEKAVRTGDWLAEYRNASAVLGREVAVTATAQGPARGVAIGAAVAAGVYGGMRDAIAAMHAGIECTYMPRQEEHAVYNKLYAEYRTLHDYFGRGANDVMKRLRALAAEQKGI